MYLALYRKYRPQSFDEVIGQNHIIKTLANQIKNDKIGHAYLFCGSRGTGKTSTAKIFAKAINCENPINGSACGKCETCKALSGNNMDILEIDAASNNGVDEIRDLREKVKYPPVAGKYKVYIIDEVHMLSPSAFNALLKTLEEPPSHAVFILATTEVHKLPATILSRCLRFDFGLVSVSELSNLVKKIFSQEAIVFEDQAIEVIARAGEGSVRDTLSIADRCISYSGENLTYKSVMEVLGTTEKDMLLQISNAVLAGDMGQSMLELDNVLSGGKSPLVLSKDLIAYFRDLLIIQTLGDKARTMVVASPETFEKMKAQATDESYTKVVALISNLSEIEAELRYSINPRIVLETAIIKTLADVSVLERVEKLEKQVSSGNFAVNNVQNAVNTDNVMQKQPEMREKVQNAQEITQNVVKNEQNNVEKSELAGPVGGQNDVSANNLLGTLLSYLRENKDMGLLSAIRQVKNVSFENNNAVFFVDDQITIDLISREKNKLILREFFDNLGISFQFKIAEKRRSGNISELSSYFNGKLEVDD